MSPRRAGAGARPAAAGKPEALESLLSERGGAPPLSLAAGPSQYWRDRLVGAFRRGAAADDAEFLRIEGDDMDGESLSGALRSLSLFASSRRLWIREAGKIHKACEEVLLSWADTPAPGLSILVTTSREPSELKFLAALAACATTVACVERPGDLRREAGRMFAEAGVRLPAPAQEAVAARAGSLQALRSECEKLSLLADERGALPANALDAVAAGRIAASVERWAVAAMRGDAAATRAEAAALDAEGAAAGTALWAVASIALAGLEPQSFAYRRGPAGPALSPARARVVLDAVYRADRAMKRGEIRDAQIRDVLERALSGGDGARDQ